MLSQSGPRTVVLHQAVAEANYYNLAFPCGTTYCYLSLGIVGNYSIKCPFHRLNVLYYSITLYTQLPAELQESPELVTLSAL